MIRFLLVFILLYSLFDTAMAAFLPKAFEATFIEEKVSVIGSKKTIKHIDVKYQFPSHIYLKVVEEDALYICNSTKVWFYTPPFIEGEPGLVKVGSSSKYCYSKVFDSLKKGLKDNKLYSVKKLKNNTFELTFMDNAKKQLGLDKLKLFFKDNKTEFQNVRSIELYYTGEAHPVALKRKKIEVSKGFKKSLFEFNPPQNTETQLMK